MAQELALADEREAAAWQRGLVGLERPMALQGRALAAHELEAVAQQRGVVQPQGPVAWGRGLVARLLEPAAPRRNLRRVSARRKRRQTAGQVA
jgi:hypothetical protein